jgi:DNA-binding XRE family transcriptional regulator
MNKIIVLDNLGERIRVARKKIGLSQAELADKVGVAINTMNRFEGGHRVPDADVVARLGKVLNCNITWLVCGEVEGHVQPNVGIPIFKNWDRVTNQGIGNDDVLVYPDLIVGDFCFRQAGMAMAPLINDGDYVVVQQDESSLSENTLVCTCDDHGHLSVSWIRYRQGKGYCVHETSAYAAVPADTVRSLGRVIATLNCRIFNL